MHAINRSAHGSIYRSIYPWIYPWIYLSIYLSIHPSIHLSYVDPAATDVDVGTDICANYLQNVTQSMGLELGPMTKAQQAFASQGSERGSLNDTWHRTGLLVDTMYSLYVFDERIHMEWYWHVDDHTCMDT